MRLTCNEKLFKQYFFNNSVIRSKRGAYFFLIDVFLVILILFVTIMTIFGFRTDKPSLLGIDQQIDTITYELFNIEIRDYNSLNMTALRRAGGAIYEEGWNNQLTVDELIILLMTNGYEIEARDLVLETVEKLPKKYGFNYAINTSIDFVTVYSRPSLVSVDASLVKLSQRKISWPRSDIDNVYSPAVTEVTLWQ